MVRPLDRLKRRSEFLSVARSRRRWATPGFVLQAAERRGRGRETAAATPSRVGFTASRKVGDAVRRNRAKRRLRALADAMLPVYAAAGHDYVMIARAGITARDHGALRRDLITALTRLKLLRQEGPTEMAQA